LIKTAQRQPYLIIADITITVQEETRGLSHKDTWNRADKRQSPGLRLTGGFFLELAPSGPAHTHAQ